MRNPNPNLIGQIKDAALKLLMEKDPSQIGMRDIASECGITATNIYHYFKDKDRLFQTVSLDCLNQLNERIKENAAHGNKYLPLLQRQGQAFSGYFPGLSLRAQRKNKGGVSKRRFYQSPNSKRNFCIP